MIVSRWIKISEKFKKFMKEQHLVLHLRPTTFNLSYKWLSYYSFKSKSKIYVLYHIHQNLQYNADFWSKNVLHKEKLPKLSPKVYCILFIYVSVTSSFQNIGRFMQIFGYFWGLLYILSFFGVLFEYKRVNIFTIIQYKIGLNNPNLGNRFWLELYVIH